MVKGVVDSKTTEEMDKSGVTQLRRRSSVSLKLPEEYCSKIDTVQIRRSSQVSESPPPKKVSRVSILTQTSVLILCLRELLCFAFIEMIYIFGVDLATQVKHEFV